MGQPQILDGDHFTLGANWDGEGVNFALFSAHAERVELCLYDDLGQQEIARVDLPRCTNHIWHGYIPGLKVGSVYGYRVYGPYDPQAGHRFNHHKLLLDPYARQLIGEFAWSDSHFGYNRAKSGESATQDLSFNTLDNAQFMLKAVVIAPIIEGVDRSAKPRISWQETTLYETHVRGFTMRHPDVPELERGTFAGLSHKKVIAYIKALGISSVELLPVHQSIDEHFLFQKGLRNYWGYNSLNFFSLHNRYQAQTDISEFRNMVDCYHEAGIEVILDVVYNHTCESNRLGPTLSFRGIDNASYYHLQAEQPRYYINDTGCGNTLNTQHPMVLRMILDSLRYWSRDMGVDGFRFDLATTLGRTKDGFSPKASLFQAIAQDPELSRDKLIAEPWDIGPGGYQVGSFPAGWSEWNDSYRDTCRKYWRKEAGILPTFARRIHGSSDIFEHSGRSPYASINFVTSHDGFTLNDLVSYKERHNLANGESNRDGHGQNLSQNFGIEGPTDNPQIIRSRQRQMRNMLATVLLSQGVPMLQAGDEFGRTLAGNNNAYCQDNELNWLDWSALQSDEQSLTAHGRFIARLIALSKRFPKLRNHEYVHPPSTIDGVSIQWLNSDGHEMHQEHWAEHHNFVLGYFLTDSAQSAVLVIFNSDDQARSFSLPTTQHNSAESWYWVLDSNMDDGEPENVASLENQAAMITEKSVAVFCNEPWTN